MAAFTAAICGIFMKVTDMGKHYPASLLNRDISTSQKVIAACMLARHTRHDFTMTWNMLAKPFFIKLGMV